MSTPFSGDGRIKVAVVTGGHAFDVPGFHALFRALPDVDPYVQHIEDFCCDCAKVKDAYHVLLFYNMHKAMPTGEEPWPMRDRKKAIESLGQTDQGIFLLHHGILSHTDWPLFQQIVGIPDRTITPHVGQTIHVDIADRDHPITRGLEPFDIQDEAYQMNGAEGESHVLLTTGHPLSLPTIGWTRQYRRSRVFCLQLGHDALAYTHPSFQTLLGRGIQWCAGRL